MTLQLSCSACLHYTACLQALWIIPSIPLHGLCLMTMPPLHTASFTFLPDMAWDTAFTHSMWALG